MGTGYTRNDTANNIADGNIINASDLDGEFDAVQSAFNASTGHTHDGTAGEGAPIETIGPSQDVVATASVLRPKTDNTVDLGTTSLEYKDLFLDGTAHIDTLDVDENASITGTLGVTAATTLSSTLGVTGATTLSSTLGVTGATTLSSTLGVTGAATLSSTLAVTGATGIDGDFDINTNKFTVASATGNTAVAGTLGVTGTTTLSSTLGVTGTTTLGTANITTGTITTADINGGNIDDTIIGATTAAAITGTTITGTSFVTSGDMTFGDDDKAIFGAGSDLQIYHDGSNSYIKDSGTGNLRINAGELTLTNADDNQNRIVTTSDGTVYLYNGGSIKLATTSTGVDVTGTLTSDGLTVDGDGLFDSDTAKVTIKSFQPKLILNDDSATGAGSDKLIIQSVSAQSAGDYEFVLNNDQTSSADQTAIKISGNGDISFYEDTGTTAKFFWDASAESLGIANSSPTDKLHVGTNSGATQIKIQSASSVNNCILHTNGTTDSWRTGMNLALTNGSYEFYDDINNVDRMVIDSSGNVGIGVSAPTGILSISGADTTSKPQLRFMSGIGTGLADAALSTTDDSGGTSLLVGSNLYYSGGSLTRFSTSRSGSAINFGYTGSMKFYTGSGNTAPDEKMRIDSSGNLLVGGTTTATKVTLNKTGFLGSSTLGSATDSTFTIDVRGNLSTDIVDGEFLGGYLLDAYDSAAASGAGVSKFNGMHFVAGGNFGASASDVDLVFATGLNGNATERMRITSGGSVLMGTTSGTGDTTNTAAIVGGYFTTQYAITSIPSINTWTTVHTFANNAGNFMVSMRASGTGNTAHNSVGVAVIQASGATAFDYIRNGGTVQIRMSGLNLQVYQGVFAGANINWGVTNLGP